MFNPNLFAHLVKTNYRSFLIIATALSVLIGIVMSVFTPETMNDIAQTNMDAPVNPLGDISTLIAFVANQYFGNFALIFAMIYCVMIGNKLVADQVDKGSMAYHLSTPITRTQYTFTSSVYFISSLTAMFALVFLVGVGVAELVQPGELPIQTFSILTLGFLLLSLAISGITFFASCLFNRSSHSLALGAGLTVFFFAANMLAGMNESLEILENATIVTLFDSAAIISGDGYGVQLLVLAGLALALHILGIIVFNRKDLPL
ncbi:ABC transporter permease subunit [Planococcus dechangensis]|uniref:ABC transporter permease subunit n=1 Tax=Planococcus dechangensis TaxID=1176255 RepID=A0ABV9MFE5_9BACL